MGNGMNKVLPGLYVGNYRDSKDHQQLERHKITHIVAIHDSPRRLLPDKHYLCVMAADTPEQNLVQYFSICNDFIHAARLREGHVLIHCLAGMSRSVTVAVAYIMSATHLSWKEALKVVRAGRAVANPNIGFQAQLQEFEIYRLSEERRRLKERFPSTALEELDRSKCLAALDSYRELLQNRDICEGNCSRGEKCPTAHCVDAKLSNMVEASGGSAYTLCLHDYDAALAPLTPEIQQKSEQMMVEYSNVAYNNSELAELSNYKAFMETCRLPKGVTYHAPDGTKLEPKADVVKQQATQKDFFELFESFQNEPTVELAVNMAEMKLDEAEQVVIKPEVATDEIKPA